MMARGAVALPLALGTLLVATLVGAQQATDPNARRDRSRDEILRRAEIRSRGRFHGEVRLVARGEARVVQTLLYSKVLRKVTARVREREAESWPAPRPGHADSLAYVAALESAEREVRQAASPKQGDRRRGLLIEFWASPSGSGVALLEPEVEKVDDELSITGARPIEELRLSRDYITRNMLLIAREHFLLEGGALEDGAIEEDELRGLLLLGD